MFTAFVFDLDGVLIDSEGVNIEAGSKTFKELGMPLSSDEQKAIIGRSSREYVPLFLSARGFTDAELHLEIRDKVRKNYDDLWESVVKFTPGVPDVVHALWSRGMKLAIATSNRRVVVEKFIVFSGLRKVFSAVVSSDDVARYKPFPDVYDLAVRQLDVRPAEAGGVEDTAIGLAAVYAAGLKGFAFPNEYTKDQDFSNAYAAIDSLDELLNFI